MNETVSTEASRRFLRWSVGMFGLAFLFFLAFSVILDSTLASTSDSLQRLTTWLTYILPALLGMVFAALSMRAPRHSTLLSVVMLAINVLVAIFFIFLVNFAG